MHVCVCVFINVSVLSNVCELYSTQYSCRSIHQSFSECRKINDRCKLPTRACIAFLNYCATNLSAMLALRDLSIFPLSLSLLLDFFPFLFYYIFYPRATKHVHYSSRYSMLVYNGIWYSAKYSLTDLHTYLQTC